VTLEIAESVPDSPVVSTPYLGANAIIADPEDHAHALGRRERHIETRHAKRTPGKQLPRYRRACLKRTPQCVVVDRSLDLEVASQGADPLAGRFGAAEVVVLDAGRDAGRMVDPAPRLLEVVVGLAGGELPDREHGALQAAGVLGRANGHLWCMCVPGLLGSP
jgi:hypothetical protein